MKQAYIEKVWIYFILAQPFIDLLTGWITSISNSAITPGAVIRSMFLLFGIFYLFMKWQVLKKSKLTRYITTLVLFLLIHILTNMVLKVHFSFVEELTYTIKNFFFIVMMIVYLTVFGSLATKSWESIILKNITIAMSIAAASILIANITGTAWDSYSYGKTGQSGWFYAANEIGAIFAITFPIVLLYAIRKTNRWKDCIYWIPVFLMAYSMMSLGTKVGYGGLIITLIIALGISLLEHIGKRINRRKAIVCLIILICICVGLTPLSPITHNTEQHLTLISEKQTEEKNTEKIQDIMLSNRDMFLREQIDDFKEAPLAQKIVGMGFGANYREKAKLIEIDFADLFFAYGIMGFLLLLWPSIYIGAQIFRKLFSHIKMYLNLEHTMLGSALILGFGVANTAGHVLTAPAVSIYLAILIPYLFIKVGR